MCVWEFWARKDVKPSEMTLPAAPWQVIKRHRGLLSRAVSIYLEVLQLNGKRDYLWGKRRGRRFICPDSSQWMFCHIQHFFPTRRKCAWVVSSSLFIPKRWYMVFCLNLEMMTRTGNTNRAGSQGWVNTLSANYWVALDSRATGTSRV